MSIEPGVTNPTVARAAAALPATGGWDAAPTEFFVSGAKATTLAFTYTRGAAGGAFDFQVEVSLYSVAARVPAGASEWTTESIYSAGAVAAGADTTSLVQRELQSYGSQGVAAEDFVYGPISMDGTIERMRVPARESGVVGTPGTLQITAQMQ
jgi:hypothetical protein